MVETTKSVDIEVSDASALIKTAIREKRYLERHGEGCPHCGPKADIDGGPLTVDSGECSQLITCMECAESWYDIYKLTGIEEQAT